MCPDDTPRDAVTAGFPPRIRRMDLSIVSDILCQLYRHGELKCTPLALYARIPYNRFRRYMDMMVVLELIVLETRPGGTFVNITERGRNFLSVVSDRGSY